MELVAQEYSSLVLLLENLVLIAVVFVYVDDIIVQLHIVLGDDVKLYSLIRIEFQVLERV